MNSRCSNPENANYPNYGARGIRVCERWKGSFEAFLADVGRRPSAGHSLDRYPEGSGNYEPGNVRWATSSEQNRNLSSNRRVSFRGSEKTLVEWTAELRIPRREFYRLSAKGVSDEHALTLLAKRYG